MPVRTRQPKKVRAQSPSATSTVLTPHAIYGLLVQVGEWTPDEAVIGTAIVLGESGGDTHAYNGTCCHGMWQIHEDHGLSISEMQGPITSTKFAKTLYEGRIARYGYGHRWDDWEVFTKGTYKALMPKAREARAYWETGKGALDPGSGVVKTEVDTGFFGDIVEGVGGVFGFFATEAAKASARWAIGATGFVGRLLYEEIMHPLWEHTQRASVYYYEEVISSKTGRNKGWYYDYAGLVTLGFWTLGYAILWRDADDGSAAGTNLERTAVGKAVRSVQQQRKAKKLYAPKEAKKETPKKPKPKESRANVTTTRFATVKRKRTVAVDMSAGNKGVTVESQQEERTPENVGS